MNIRSTHGIPIKKRIFKVQLIISVITIIVIYAATFTLSYYNTIERVEKVQQVYSTTLNVQIDSFFENIHNDWAVLSNMPELRRLLVHDNENPDIPVEALESLEREILDYLLNSNISIFSMNRLIPHNKQMSPNPDFNIRSTQWYQEFNKLPLDQKIYYDNNRSYYIAPDQVMSQVFGIMNFTETELIGFAKFDIPYTSLKLFIKNFVTSDSPVVIKSESNETLISFNIDKEALEILENKNLSNNIYTIIINDINYSVVQHQSPLTGLIVTTLIPLTPEIHAVVNQSLLLMPIFLLILVINILVSNNLSAKIVNPIRNLSSGVRATRNSSLKDFKPPTTDISEVHELGDAFKDMLTEIDMLVIKNQKQNLLRVESQLSALRQQINPHFLFNTLEVISGQAILENAYDTSIMTQKLGSLFRYNLQTESVTTLKNELKYINDYIFLQNIGYDQPIELNITIDEKLFDTYIPKLTLQPIIENSIRHGFADMELEEKSILISTHISKEILYLSVQDNGCGISHDDIKRLNNMLSLDAKDFHHFINRGENIGLRNINAILSLQFDYDQPLSISSQSSGTNITLKIPLLREENI